MLQINKGRIWIGLMVKKEILKKKLDGKFLITKITNPNLVKLVQIYK